MHPVALLTDFGLDDPYLGQMKGAIIRAAPGTTLIDITHGIPPFDLVRAGFFLEASHPHFPLGSIFVCVVDPGVGGERNVICLDKSGQKFLTPDNGLISLTLAAKGKSRAFIVEPARVKAKSVSSTFHGRDLFAPAAGLLAGGLPPSELGRETDPGSLKRLPWAAPRIRREPEPGIEATVLHADRFGNLILNIPLSDWPGQVSNWPGGVRLVRPMDVPLRLAKTYGELVDGEFGLISGSQGFVELSMNRDSAAKKLSLAAGETTAFAPVGEPS